MKRVAVLGPCGSGKSTFSKVLAHKSILPLIHLDQHFFSSNWKEPDTQIWRQKVMDIVQPDHWIIDGNYGGTLDIRLERADTIIYIDNGTLSNIYRVIKRIFQYHGKVRPDMAEGCRERFDLDFLHYVATFNMIKKPSILRRMERYREKKSVFVLSSEVDRKEFLKSIDGHC